MQSCTLHNTSKSNLISFLILLENFNIEIANSIYFFKPPFFDFHFLTTFVLEYLCRFKNCLIYLFGIRKSTLNLLIPYHYNSIFANLNRWNNRIKNRDHLLQMMGWHQSLLNPRSRTLRVQTVLRSNLLWEMCSRSWISSRRLLICVSKGSQHPPVCSGASSL